MRLYVNSKEEGKALDTAKLLKEGENSLKSYFEIERSYIDGAISFPTMHHYHKDIIEKSPYYDEFDFLYDYQRYKVGLPIFIEIIVKEEKE